MDPNPPTAGDYAWAAANDAKREIEKLKRQVKELQAAAGIVEPEPPKPKYRTMEQFLAEAIYPTVKMPWIDVEDESDT